MTEVAPPTTFATHQTAVRVHIIPNFAAITLTRLTPRDVQAFYGIMSDAG